MCRHTRLRAKIQRNTLKRQTQILLGHLSMWISHQGRSKYIIQCYRFLKLTRRDKGKKKRVGPMVNFYPLMFLSKQQQFKYAGYFLGSCRMKRQLRLWDLLIHIHEIYSNYKQFPTLSGPTAIARTSLITYLFCNKIQLSNTNYLTQDILSLREAKQLL